jgi:hypothetical protein
LLDGHCHDSIGKQFQDNGESDGSKLDEGEHIWANVGLAKHLNGSSIGYWSYSAILDLLVLVCLD